MIYVGDKKATPYYEDYKPVNVYRNNVKIAGWRVDEKSGTSIEWADIYNDKVVSAVVSGASTQVVTFVPDSPSPDYPSPIISAGEVSGIDLTVTGNAGQSYQVHRDMVLRSLPDGTHDTWDAVTGTVTRNVGVNVFDGTETRWQEHSPYVTLLLSPAAVFSSILSPPLLCSHANMSIDSVCWANASRLRVTMAYFGCNNLADWKSFLAAQYAAGTPVTVYYKLAAPITEQIDPAPLPTYPRYTALICNAEVTARVRVIEHGL